MSVSMEMCAWKAKCVLYMVWWKGKRWRKGEKLLFIMIRQNNNILNNNYCKYQLCHNLVFELLCILLFFVVLSNSLPWLLFLFIGVPVLLLLTFVLLPLLIIFLILLLFPLFFGVNTLLFLGVPTALLLILFILLFILFVLINNLLLFLFKLYLLFTFKFPLLFFYFDDYYNILLLFVFVVNFTITYLLFYLFLSFIFIC